MQRHLELVVLLFAERLGIEETDLPEMLASYGISASMIASIVSIGAEKKNA
jgi:hypothetical protein